MRLLLTAFLLSTMCAAQTQSAPASAADSPIAAEAAAMSHLDFMLGTWTGNGWIMLGRGQRSEFTQTEIVTKKLGGTLFTIDGDGRDAANPERHIHDAFAVISFSPETHQYRFTPYSGGHMLDVAPIVGDRVFTWGYDAPYGTTRFTLDYTSGQWHETGELSRDNGKTWTKNFEMTLTRSK